MVILTNPKQKPYNPSRTFLHFKLIHLKFQGDGVQCEESELWLRVCGRVREEEQEFDEASAGRSSEILTHSSCLTSLRGPGKRVPAFLIIPTGRWLGDIPILGDGTETPLPPLTKTINSLPPKLQRGGCIALLFSGTEPRHVLMVLWCQPD